MKRFGMVAVALLLLARPSFASSITYFDTITNTDVATSVIGLRDLSGGDITISGVTGTVTHAYLFWHGPTNTTDTTINQNITFNGTNIVGTSLGLSHDNFWDVAPGQGTYANSQAYRADVTSLVQLDPDGTYSLSNMLNTPGLGLENGASLWVFYDDGDASNNRDVYMFNGNDGNWPNAYDEDGWDFTLTGFNYNGGTAYLDTFVSDGQTFVDSALLFNGTQVAPVGPIFEGLGPAAPGAFDANGSLVDINRYDISSLLSIGPSSLRIQTGTEEDAVSFIVGAINLPSQTAPVPEPGTMVLVGFGLAALRKYRRA